MTSHIKQWVATVLVAVGLSRVMGAPAASADA